MCIYYLIVLEVRDLEWVSWGKIRETQSCAHSEDSKGGSVLCFSPSFSKSHGFLGF